MSWREVIERWDPVLDALRAEGYEAQLSSPAFPVQLEGRLPSGRTFYFRERSGHCFLGVGGSDPAWEPDWKTERDLAVTGDPPQFLEPEHAARILEDMLSERPALPLYPCPCCGHLTFSEPPGSYEICPVCFWEDDAVQLRWPTYGGGANRPSLLEAQQNFVRFGAVEEGLIQHVRAATLAEPLDEGWHPIDLQKDPIPDYEKETRAWMQSREPQVSASIRSVSPPWDADATSYYYWRSGYAYSSPAKRHD